MALEQVWLRLQLSCPSDETETLGALLMEHHSLGLEEQSQEDGDVLLTAYFSHPLGEGQAETIESALAACVPGPFSWSLFQDDGWSTRWQEHFKPFAVGEGLVICPSWESYEPKPGQKLLLLDPGMAFGTGTHATTRGSLLLMERYLVPEHVVLDVGCGSGILSLAALLCGASHAVGVDIDPEAVRVSRENAEINHLAEKTEFSTTPIEEVDGEYPFVLANIQAHILIPMVEPLVARVATGAYLLLSGIIDTKRDAVVACYETNGCELVDEFVDEGWHSMVLRRLG